MEHLLVMSLSGSTMMGIYLLLKRLASGTASEHTQKSDGSCEGKEYYAQRCSICGYVAKGERICAYIKAVCPHE